MRIDVKNKKIDTKTIVTRKGCKKVEDKTHKYVLSLPYAFPKLLKEYGTPKKYYNRPFSKKELKTGRMVYFKCINCSKVKMKIIEEDEILDF